MSNSDESIFDSNFAAWQRETERCMHELFEEQVERTPEAVAVSMGQQSLTYRELNLRSNQLAHHLRQLGVGPEAMVGVCLERSLEVVVGLLGILKAGGAYVPIDHEAPTDRIAFLLEDADVHIMVTQQRLVERLPKNHPALICLDSDWPRLRQQSEENPTHNVQGHHLAYVIYTSGSTGRPKGVLIEHRALAAHCQTIIQTHDLRPDDSCLQFAPFTFDASVEQMFPALLVGARVVLRGEEIWTSFDLLRQIRSQHLTVVSLPTSYWNQAMSEWAAASEDLSDHPIRVMIAGGERFPHEMARLWYQLPLRSARFFNAYGPTEGTVTSATFELSPEIALKETETSVPLGRAVLNRTLYVLDRANQPVSVGVVGELHIGGRCLARGYLNRPELTAECFVPNPFSQQPEDRLYKTGDLVRYLPDGMIEFVGRRDTQVKIRGFRIELGEIEAVLAEHEAVQQAVVVAREDGHGGKRLVGYVVRNPQYQVERDEEKHTLISRLRALLEERLPVYMIPGALVLLESLPLTANGKVNVRALPEPDVTHIERTEQLVTPRTSLEESIADIWREVLGIEQVGVYDNFFMLGGHSLLAIQVITQLQLRLRVDVTVRHFFEAPTVAELAAIITSLQRETIPAPTRPVLRAVSRQAYRVSSMSQDH